MRCSRGAKGRQANAAKPGFFPGKLIYDHKKRSCGTGHTISTILKHEFRKKDQDGMGKVREGGGGPGVTAYPGFGETCQVFILAAARCRWTPLPKMRALS